MMRGGETQRDPAAARLRYWIEGDLSYVRWVLLAAAIVYLLFSPTVVAPGWGWGGVLVGALANGAVLTWRRIRPGSIGASAVAQMADTAALGLYAKALRGGVPDHLGYYVPILILAAMRFGPWGTVLAAVAGVLLGIGTSGLALRETWEAVLASRQAPPAMTFGIILVSAALLAYYARLVQRQRLAFQTSEERLRRTISEITVLHEVSGTVHDLKSEDALQNIVEIATRVLGFRSAALFLTERVTESIPRQYHSHLLPMQVAGPLPIRMTTDLFRQILEREEPIVIDGSQCLADIESGPRPQIAVPLHGADGPIGVLVADSGDRRATLRSDRDMLDSLARSAVVAIENANLHHRIREMANRDGLTDLYNHRYFQEWLRKELDAAGANWPVTLFMIEIDRFKAYNDTFGHRQGDTVLISLARALEQSVQPWQAMVARYGGDEFVVILPRVRRAEAARLAGELREQVCAQVSDMLAAHGLPPVSLSIGLATYPEDALTAGSLIDAADQAMYIVKRSGGGKIHVFTESHTVGGQTERT